MRSIGTRFAALIGGATAVALAIVAVVALLPSPADDGPVLDDRAAGTTTASAAPAPTPSDTIAGGLVETPPASFLVAALSRDVERFAAPDAGPIGTVSATWHGRPSRLPVIDQRPGWLHVRLPQRPNGSTAWIRRHDVELLTTPYRIEVDVATLRLKLYKAGEVVLDAPIGIGTDDAPTTIGNFFVTFLQAPPDSTSGWGPFVMVTSSHSETISDFQSSGDAIAAIHGPLGSEDAIGDTGAKVSHGCIRLHLEHLEALRVVPAGSPIDVIDSSVGVAQEVDA